jgi:putative addiction module component (TIGR02574 family)
MSSKQNIMLEALQLSEAERLEVAEALYASLEGPPDPGADEAWSAEIQRRIAELDSGKVKTIPWEQARRTIAGE